MITNLDDEIWNAIITCNSHYDGLLFYAVKTTGIFCFFSCKSKVPNRENVVVFESFDEATASGFRPCKRCRPDIGPDYSPDEQIVRKARHLLEGHYVNPDILVEAGNNLGLSRFHFQRLFKKYTGNTPKEYVTKLRVEKAQDLLKQNSIGNLEIGMEVGFKSLSTFYETFRKQTGLTPKEYQRQFREESERNCDAHDGSENR